MNSCHTFFASNSTNFLFLHPLFLWKRASTLKVICCLRSTDLGVQKRAAVVVRYDINNGKVLVLTCLLFLQALPVVKLLRGEITFSRALQRCRGGISPAGCRTDSCLKNVIWQLEQTLERTLTEQCTVPFVSFLFLFERGCLAVGVHQAHVHPKCHRGFEGRLFQITSHSLRTYWWKFCDSKWKKKKFSPHILARFQFSVEPSFRTSQQGQLQNNIPTEAYTMISLHQTIPFNAILSFGVMHQGK